MRKYVYLLAAAVIAASSLSAHSDTISTFELTNFVFELAPAVTSGNLTIDTTTGIATGLHFDYSNSEGTFSVSQILVQGATRDGSLNFVAGASSENPNDLLSLWFLGPSLINYAGGPACAIDPTFFLLRESGPSLGR